MTPLYTEAELAAFYAIWSPPVPTKPRAPDHEAILEARRKLQEAGEMARLVDPPPKRTPEAVCRGYSSPAQLWVPQPGPTVPQLPGDDRQATRAWVHYMLGKIPGFEHLHTAQELKDGHQRELWRAAAAGLLRRPPKDVRDPSRYLLACLSHIACGHGMDPRRHPDFAAQEGWPAELAAFAGVRPFTSQS